MQNQTGGKHAKKTYSVGANKGSTRQGLALGLPDMRSKRQLSVLPACPRSKKRAFRCSDAKARFAQGVWAWKGIRTSPVCRTACVKGTVCKNRADPALKFKVSWCLECGPGNIDRVTQCTKCGKALCHDHFQKTESALSAFADSVCKHCSISVEEFAKPREVAGSQL